MFGFQNDETKAAGLIGQFEKVRAAIAGELQALDRAKAKQAESQRALDNALTEQTLAAAGELGGVGAAREHVKEHDRYVADAAARVSALRTKLLALVGGMPELYGDLMAGLRDQNAKLEAELRQEWGAAATAFARVIARRAAVQHIVGTLDLPSAESLVPQEPSVAEISPAHHYVGQLKAAVKALGADGQLAPVLSGGCPAPDGALDTVSSVQSGFRDVDSAVYRAKVAELKARVA